MELFDKKFVYFTWDDELVGKQVFAADYIPDLKGSVNAENYSRVEVKESDREDFPFQVLGDDEDEYLEFMFVYYDPLYDYKVAYNNGASIEYRSKGNNTKWALVGTPIWDDERYEYRIKPKETVATNREVLEWLAEGYGMVKAYQNTVTISFCISEEDMDKPCMHKVCKWRDREWHDATREYLGIVEWLR